MPDMPSESIPFLVVSAIPPYLCVSNPCLYPFLSSPKNTEWDREAPFRVPAGGRKNSKIGVWLKYKPIDLIKFKGTAELPSLCCDAIYALAFGLRPGVLRSDFFVRPIACA